MILILSTFSNKEEARKIGIELLKRKLIACYNLTPVESAFLWKGKIEENKEILMIMKTSRKFEEVEKFILKNHSYETPEIVEIEISKVTKKYLKWIKDL